MHAASCGLARLRRAASASDSSVDLAAEPMTRYRAVSPMRSPTDLAMAAALAAAHAVASAGDLEPEQRRALLGSGPMSVTSQKNE